ncbi:hypothetical protein C0J52_17422 [Blattella germanica]|nr:hypothetical protein C0J52_17422 [Blattella germanica]
MNRLSVIFLIITLSVVPIYSRSVTLPSTRTMKQRKANTQRIQRAERRDGYVEYTGFGSYKVHTDELTWDAARRKCDEENAHLICINSEKESKLARTLIDKEKSLAKADTIFIGMHDRFVTREFLTLTGEPLGNSGFTRWHKGEPSSESEHCGCINRHDGGLCDTNCKNRLPFICEREKI